MEVKQTKTLETTPEIMPCYAIELVDKDGYYTGKQYFTTLEEATKVYEKESTDEKCFALNKRLYNFMYMYHIVLDEKSNIISMRLLRSCGFVW